MTQIDPIIAAAVVSGAKYIVTLDNDLLVIGEHNGIAIVEPEKFKEELAKQ
ncbi:MAG: hypothetical protein PVI21_03065 [Candidatus Woesebacteria bacterium]